VLNLGLWAFGIGLQAYILLLALEAFKQDACADSLVMVNAPHLALTLLR
jgi:hypothetical protein